MSSICLHVAGGYNGSLIYWLADTNQYAHTAIGDAHRQSIDVIAWHPGGHLVATASHDCILKFWCREGPGSKIENKSASEFTESQPPLYGYGPLPPETIPSVIIQSNSAQQLASSSTTNAVQPAVFMPTGSRFTQPGANTKFVRPPGSNFQQGRGYSGRGDGAAGRKRPRDG